MSILQDNKYIHSFEDNSDYVYDVQWSPIHPALFASVDGMGRLDLWNLNQDTEVNISQLECQLVLCWELIAQRVLSAFYIKKHLVTFYFHPSVQRPPVRPTDSGLDSKLVFIARLRYIEVSCKRPEMLRGFYGRTLLWSFVFKNDFFYILK